MTNSKAALPSDDSAANNQRKRSRSHVIYNHWGICRHPIGNLVTSSGRLCDDHQTLASWVAVMSSATQKRLADAWRSGISCRELAQSAKCNKETAMHYLRHAGAIATVEAVDDTDTLRKMLSIINTKLGVVAMAPTPAPKPAPAPTSPTEQRLGRHTQRYHEKCRELAGYNCVDPDASPRRGSPEIKYAIIDDWARKHGTDLDTAIDALATAAVSQMRSDGRSTVCWAWDVHSRFLDRESSAHQYLLDALAGGTAEAVARIDEDEEITRQYVAWAESVGKNANGIHGKISKRAMEDAYAYFRNGLWVRDNCHHGLDGFCEGVWALINRHEHRLVWPNEITKASVEAAIMKAIG